MDITTNRFDNYYHHPTPAPLRPVLRLCSSDGRHIPIDVSYTSIIIPSGYAVLCSSDACQLSTLHQPRIHPRSISERCFFSPIFPLAILKVVFWSPALASFLFILPVDYPAGLTFAAMVYYPLCVLLIILSGLMSV